MRGGSAQAVQNDCLSVATNKNQALGHVTNSLNQLLPSHWFHKASSNSGRQHLEKLERFLAFHNDYDWQAGRHFPQFPQKPNYPGISFLNIHEQHIWRLGSYLEYRFVQIPEPVDGPLLANVFE